MERDGEEVWSTVYGLWSMVYGLWSMVYGLGLWSMVDRHLPERGGWGEREGHSDGMERDGEESTDLPMVYGF